jgi:hypothetical protein
MLQVRGKGMFAGVALLLVVAIARPGAVAQAEGYIEAPRVAAALQQGHAAEFGIGIRRNPLLAVALYCDAGMMGSPEGFFRVGRVLASAPRPLRNPAMANAYLALAARLGHHEALSLYDARVANAVIGDECGLYGSGADGSRFDLDGYLAGQSPAKQRIALLIRSAARQYQVDPRLALAIAIAESNLDAAAVSPRNAQGVMQLIPATQERFGVTRPFDPEHNVRGALAYLRWLDKRFAGNWRLIAAAYNAGEGEVDRYSGVPPFAETRQYVRRVLHFSGFATRERG